MNTDGIRLFLQNPRVRAAAALTGSFAVGAALSFVVTRKALASKYEEQAQREILESKLFYQTMYKKDSFSTPEEAAAVLLGGDSEYTNIIVRDAAEALKAYSGEGILVDPKNLVEITKNVFTDAALPEDDEWDLERELTHRTNEQPYVISADEYLTNETGYQQITVTYYEADDVLSDDKDQVIDDSEGTVGDHNMSRFGHGSKDANVVYIRNDKLEVEFEVCRSGGSYSREVLGFDPELKHSATLRRFRDRDE